MNPVWQKALLIGLVTMLVGILPMQGFARPIAAVQTCHATAAQDERYADLRRNDERWICDSSRYDTSPDSIFLRYRLNPTTETERARSFVAQAGPFAAITIWVVDTNGAVSSQRFAGSTVRHSTGGPFMAVMLPTTPAATQLVVVRIDRPWIKSIASQAWLDSKPEGTGWSNGEMVAMALICGMLLAPLLLNLAFFTVLRRSFVLWNVGVIFCMLVQALMKTGFVHLVIDIDSYVESSVGTISLLAGVACSLMLIATFIEPDCQSLRIRALLKFAAPMLVFTAVISELLLQELRSYGILTAYIAAGLTVPLMVAALIDAWQRGSRAVYFLIAGWAPILVIAAYRIASYLLPTANPTESVLPFQLAVALDVLVVSLGIVVRFVDLRLERDRATARAIELEDVAGHDPLTGLWNRRSIEQQFEALYADGFRTMAVLDLDHFKSVNDQYGHGVGDMVLKVAATALGTDSNTRAVRMGGEEFLLLLRGADAADRAENHRRAITIRVAADVPGLGHLVTASMGLVEHDHRGSPANAAFKVEFTALCAHCDRLLYEAKRHGRNRMVREKFTSFSSDQGSKTAAITG